jgi:hypothetical protein
VATEHFGEQSGPFGNAVSYSGVKTFLMRRRSSARISSDKEPGSVLCKEMDETKPCSFAATLNTTASGVLDAWTDDGVT